MMPQLFNQYRTPNDTIEATRTIVGFRSIVEIKWNFSFMLQKQHNILSLPIKTAFDMIMIPIDPFSVELTKYSVNLNEATVVSVILSLTNVDSGQTYHFDLTNTRIVCPCLAVACHVFVSVGRAIVPTSLCLKILAINVATIKMIKLIQDYNYRLQLCAQQQYYCSCITIPK